MTFGATYLGDNRTHFRLWAPGADSGAASRSTASRRCR